MIDLLGSITRFAVHAVPYRRGRNLREEVDKIKVKVEEVRKQVSVKSKNRTEGGRSWNRLEQVIFNNVRARTEEGPGKQGEWIKVR